LGASVAGGIGGWTNFFYARTSAENCTIINEGATAAGAIGGTTVFQINTRQRAMPRLSPTAEAMVAGAESLVSITNLPVGRREWNSLAMAIWISVGTTVAR